MPAVIQRSFATGVLSDVLGQRADQQKYQYGLRSATNAYVLRHGALCNRPGSVYVGQPKDPTTGGKCRWIPFVLNDSVTYNLLFGTDSSGLGYVHIYDGDGLLVIPDASTWSAVWADATAYTGGQVLRRSTALYWCRRAHTSSAANDEPTVGTNWEEYWYAFPIDGSDNATIELPTPYSSNQVRGEGGKRPLGFAQDKDVMWFTHDEHNVRQLSRISETEWRFEAARFQPGLDAPTGFSVATHSGNAKVRRWRVTSVQADTLIESIPALGTFQANVTCGGGVAGTNPMEFNYTSHPFSDGDLVVFDVEDGLATSNFDQDDGDQLARRLRGREWVVTSASANVFSIDLDISDLGAGSETASLPVHLPWIQEDGPVSGIDADPFLLSWTPVAGAQEYNIYKDDTESGDFGYLATARLPSFSDTEVDDPNYEERPPLWRDPFNAENEYPAVIGFYQQRMVLASTKTDPGKVWFSRINDYLNFTSRSPLQDDDGIIVEIAGREAQEVRGLLDLGQRFIILTNQGEWVLAGNADGLLSQATVTLRQDGYDGSSDVRPLVVSDTAMFVQARGSQVQDLRFQFEADSYQGQDLTTFAPHLVDHFEIIDWTYARIPHSVIWAVRSDGRLLSLTYLRQQNIWAWCLHDTRGTVSWDGAEATAIPLPGPVHTVESVSAIPEGDYDALYMVVSRTLNGTTTRVLEKLVARKAGSPVYDARSDARFMDCHLQYDGTNTTATTLEMAEIASGGYAVGASVTLTASASAFVVGDVDTNGYRLAATDQFGIPVEVEVLVTAFSSATSVTGTISRIRYDGVLQTATGVEADVALQEQATASWVYMLAQVSGLSHLNNEQVYVLADGVPIGNKRVSSGIVSLPVGEPAGIITVGLPIHCMIETLGIDAVTEDPLPDKLKRLKRTQLFVEQTRGLQVAPSNVENDPDWVASNADWQGDPDDDPTVLDDIELCSGLQDVPTIVDRARPGRVLVRQARPLPFTLTALGRVFDAGGRP